MLNAASSGQATTACLPTCLEVSFLVHLPALPSPHAHAPPPGSDWKWNRFCKRLLLWELAFFLLW